MESVIVDTGVWYALFDSHDSNFHKSADKAELLGMLDVVVPWPTAYETLRTRFVRKATALRRFERFLESPNIQFLEDEIYRRAAFQLSLDSSLRKRRPLSMVDCLLRLIINDVNTKIRYLATFNVSDFYDICKKNQVEII